jgi:hypothetical protein
MALDRYTTDQQAENALENGITTPQPENFSSFSLPHSVASELEQSDRETTRHRAVNVHLCRPLPSLLGPGASFLDQPVLPPSPYPSSGGHLYHDFHHLKIINFVPCI